jgi:hypothetical protein
VLRCGRKRARVNFNEPPSFMFDRVCVHAPVHCYTQMSPILWRSRNTKARTVQHTCTCTITCARQACHWRAPKFAERTRLRTCTHVASCVRWCFILDKSWGLFGHMTRVPLCWDPNFDSAARPV